MRRILRERTRHNKRQKCLGDWQCVDLADHPPPATDCRLLALDEAQVRVVEKGPFATRVVESRHFAGLGHERVPLLLCITIYQVRQK